MKPITLKEALMIYVNAVLDDSIPPTLYVQDDDDCYHMIMEIDLNKYGMYCTDSYWANYKYILDMENSENYKLFIEENNYENTKN